MKLQSVYQKIEASQASSLYCQWVRSEPGTASTLVAIWVDREMRTFEPAFLGETAAEMPVEQLAEDASQRQLHRRQYSAERIEEAVPRP